MIRKFALDFVDQDELDCYLIDLALLRVGEAENNPHPELYPRYLNPDLNKRFTRSTSVWGDKNASTRKQIENMSGI